MSSEVVALLPCPFCGGKAREYHVRGISGWTINCVTCGAAAYESDPQRVRLHWNTRLATQPDAATVARAEGAGEAMREAAVAAVEALDCVGAHECRMRNRAVAAIRALSASYHPSDEDAQADAYLEDYVMSTEGADYEPTEWERELIADALHGFIAERGALSAPSPETREAGLREALTPSAETKAAYIGEFGFNIVDRDEDGEEIYRRVLVPWDTIKEVMAAILARAALAERCARPAVSEQIAEQVRS